MAWTDGDRDLVTYHVTVGKSLSLNRGIRICGINFLWDA